MKWVPKTDPNDIYNSFQRFNWLIVSTNRITNWNYMNEKSITVKKGGRSFSDLRPFLYFDRSTSTSLLRSRCQKSRSLGGSKVGGSNYRKGRLELMRTPKKTCPNSELTTYMRLAFFNYSICSNTTISVILWTFSSISSDSATTWNGTFWKWPTWPSWNITTRLTTRFAIYQI